MEGVKISPLRKEFADIVSIVLRANQFQVKIRF